MWEDWPYHQRLSGKKVVFPFGAGPILTGYRKSPSSAPLPIITVNIEGIGEVVALVDSGASSSAIRRSLANKLNKCVGPSVRFREWDSKTVAIDSFVNMEITWEGRKTAVKRVASVKHPPFPLILGVDWIVDSKTNLIVSEETIVPVAQQIEEASVGESVEESEKQPVNISIQPEESLPPVLSPIPSKPGKERKKVSFGLVRVREFYPDTFEPINDEVQPDFVFECKE